MSTINTSLNYTGYFDIVIGNPPYVDSEMMTNIGLDEIRKYIQKNYSYISGNWDIYMAFFEKGLNFSRSILCYITPDKWLSRPFGLKFREKCLIPRMYKILHVGSKIFDSVRVDAIISLFTKKSDVLIALKYGMDKIIKEMNSIKKKELQSPYLIDSLFSDNYLIINKIDCISNKKLSDLNICEGACATNDAYN